MQGCGIRTMGDGLRVIGIRTFLVPRLYDPATQPRLRTYVHCVVDTVRDRNRDRQRRRCEIETKVERVVLRIGRPSEKGGQ
jgi:hypothetical protein